MSGQLAAVVLAVLVAGALAVVGLAARWVVGHPARIRAGLAWVAEHPAVVWVRSRYPRQWRFLDRRLAPGEATGLALTLGVGMVLALGMSFRQLLDNVLESDGIAVADHPVLRFLAAHREPWLVTTMQVISDVGSPVGAGIMATLVGVALAWIRRSWLPLLIAGFGAAGIGMINLSVKWLVSRNRPPVAIAVLGEDGFSFPSGHTTGTTVVWLLSAWMVSRWVIRGRVVQDMVWTGAVLVIVAVGISRVYLGVHFPSDVMAGWTLGAAWAVMIALVVNVWEQSQRASPASVGPRGLDTGPVSRGTVDPG
ncbi:MAG: phosphatase PAP2 family protein [Actinomycetota bacterium]|nr:phosphatase PAP2 family protein [Actinomycetota bacterium]